MSNMFILSLKKDFVESRKSVLLALASIFGMTIVIGSIFGYNGAGRSVSEVVVLGFALIVAGYAITSMAFQDLNGKQRRIATIMLPVSQHEKYIIRWIIFGPVLTLLLVAAFYVGDMARIGVGCLRYGLILGENYYRIVNPYDVLDMRTGIKLEYREIWTVASSYLFFHSLFFFGAVLWPKISFLKTIAAIWALNMLLTFIGIIVVKHIYVITFDIKTTMIVSNSIHTLVAIVIYILAYVRFKRSQVVYKLI